MKRQGKVLKYVVLSSLLSMSITSAVFAQEPPKEEIPTYDLGQVIVVASRTPTRITDAKADVSVVSRKEIEEMHMTTVEEALRTVPGVQFLNYGSNGINANLSGLRINGSKDIVILVDGVRVTDFQGSGNSGYMYSSLLSNMDSIERVEILRGAAGTLYGSGAKGGVINIITRQIDNNRSTIDIVHGSYGKEQYKFNTQGKYGKVGYNAYFGKDIISNTKDGDGNEWEGHTNTKNYGTKITYDFNKNQKLTLNYERAETNYSGQDYIYKGRFTGNYASTLFSLKHDYTISDHWNNTLVYRTNRTKTLYGKPASYGTVGLPSDFNYHFISEQANFHDVQHNLVFGMDYSKGYNNLSSVVGYDYVTGNILWGHRSMRNYSYYVQDDWKIIPKLTLSGGIRYDKPKSDAYSPEFASHTTKSYKLSYDITDKDCIYAGRSDFYILPSMDQLYNSKWGNAKLAPATGRTTSVGYNKKFDDNNYLTFNWFDTKSEKTIGYDGDGHYQNYDNAVSRGWNAQYTTQIGQHWNANVGWAHLFYYAKGDNFAKGYYPENMLTFGVNYNYAKVTAGLNGFYFMRKINHIYDGMQGWPADNYGVYNLSVNYSPTKNFTIYTKVDNIFNKLWAEHTDVIWNGKPGTWYAMPGRAITVGMQIKF